MSFLLVKKSANVKTGPIPVTISESNTCPDSCPLKAAGCYAKYGNVAIHWRRVSENRQGVGWKEFLKGIRDLPFNQLFRHNQAGDLPGIGDKINKKKLFALASAAKDKRGFTYTHKPVLNNSKNKEYINHVNKNTNFTINLSANSPEEAAKLKDLNIGPVVTLLPLNTPNTQFINSHKIILCPAQYKEGVTCESCRLCQNKNRSVIIGFRAHGSGKRKVDSRLQGDMFKE